MRLPFFEDGVSSADIALLSANITLCTKATCAAFSFVIDSIVIAASSSPSIYTALPESPRLEVTEAALTEPLIVLDTREGGNEKEPPSFMLLYFCVVQEIRLACLPAAGSVFSVFLCTPGLEAGDCDCDCDCDVGARRSIAGDRCIQQGSFRAEGGRGESIHVCWEMFESEGVPVAVAGVSRICLSASEAYPVGSLVLLSTVAGPDRTDSTGVCSVRLPISIPLQPVPARERGADQLLQASVVYLLLQCACRSACDPAAELITVMRLTIQGEQWRL